MLDRILGFEYTLWLVAFAFYAFDVGVVARADDLLFVESWKRLRPILARVPFSFRGGDLYWVAPLAPFLAVFRGGLTGTSQTAADPAAANLPAADAATQAALAAIGNARARLWPFRWTSTLIFVLLFIAGPALTAWRGLGLAALIVLPPAYLISLVGVVFMVRRATVFGLNRRALWSLGFDSLACIPYAANLTKRVALRLDGSGRAEAWMQCGALPEEVAHVHAVLAERKAQS